MKRNYSCPVCGEYSISFWDKVKMTDPIINPKKFRRPHKCHSCKTQFTISKKTNIIQLIIILILLIIVIVKYIHEIYFGYFNLIFIFLLPTLFWVIIHYAKMRIFNDEIKS